MFFYGVRAISGFFILFYCCSASAQQFDTDEDAWLSEDGWQSDDAGDENLDVRGFLDFGLGGFVHDSITESKQSLAEARGQLSLSGYVGDTYLTATAELVIDNVADHNVVLTVRELYLDRSIGEYLNIRLGQQVLSWGTGDFVFINDFFPKDWQAMFSGRDDQYLKATSKALKVSYQGALFNSDVIWTPDFEKDSFIDGERFGFYNPDLSRVSTSPRLHSEEPKTEFSNGTLALRFSKTLKGSEYALYGYRGYFTQPLAFDPQRLSNYFPRLNSLGTSLRRPLIGGLVNVELAYLDAVGDRDGTDPSQPNSQWKLLLGHERELKSRLTAAVQIYTEKISNYGAYKLGLENVASHKQAQWHSNLSLRLSYRSENESFTWSLFGFYSPNARDYYIKPRLNYRYSDHWAMEVGANYFEGNEQQQWGQFNSSSNIFVRIKYTF